MKLLFFLLFLMGNVLLHAQNLEEIELNLGKAVADWQKAATNLDNSVIDLKKLTDQYEELFQAAEWLKRDMENVSQGGEKKDIIRSNRAYRIGKRKMKTVERALFAKQKKVEKLTDLVAIRKVRMNELLFAKESFLNGDGYVQEKRVYSGYFPAAEDFYLPSIKDDLLYNPLDYRCVTVYDEIDPMTQKHRVDMGEDLFFSHHRQGVPLFEGKPYMTCNSSMTLIEGGVFFLNLSFLIHTENARKSFGYLERRSRLVLTFLDGEELVLLNNLLNLGQFNKKDGTVLFRGQYSLSVHAQNLIEKSSVDKVMVEWAKGYEYYEVYNVDLLKKQLKCL